jgi:hypothetical protein
MDCCINMDYGLLYKYGLWTCKLSMINCKKYGGIVNYLWSNVNSEQSGEEESNDSGIIGDYETPSEYESSEPRPHRHPEDDDVDYKPSDNEVCMHIHSN